MTHIQRGDAEALAADHLIEQAKADAWDEGWSKCSDWWHANAVGESHTVDPSNPYRAAAIREWRQS